MTERITLNTVCCLIVFHCVIVCNNTERES